MNRRAGRDRVFARALVASAVLHLSAVTLFRIVIYFPREDIEYFEVSIVEAAPSRSLSVPAPSSDAMPDSPEFDTPDFGQTLALSDPLRETLPEIELPTLKFEELSLLRLRQEALQVRSRYDEIFASRGGSEPLTRLGSGLDTVSETLSRLTFGGGTARPADRPRPMSRPAPGFEAYVEWSSEPKDRQAFTVQAIPELRGMSQDAVSEPITLAFRVDRDGVVTQVLNPVGASHQIAAAAAEALREYRFEPLIGDGPQEQGGTFILRAGGDGA